MSLPGASVGADFAAVNDCQAGIPLMQEWWLRH